MPRSSVNCKGLVVPRKLVYNHHDLSSLSKSLMCINIETVLYDKQMVSFLKGAEIKPSASQYHRDAFKLIKSLIIRPKLYHFFIYNVLSPIDKRFSLFVQLNLIALL